MIPVKLHLSTAQKSKARNGKQIQVKHTHIGKGENYNLSEANIKKLVKSLKTNKACRITLCEDEIVGSGLGKKIGKAFKKVKHELKIIMLAEKLLIHWQRLIRN